MSDIFDTIIIGAGPAGLSAGIYAARAEMNFMIIERSSAVGGQVLSTYEVENYPGIPSKSGSELSDCFREHCEKLGCSFVTGEVVDIQHVNGLLPGQGSFFEVSLIDGRSFTSRAVIAATGASHKTLGVKGEEEFAGMGVSYCATCDGAFFKNKAVTVIGGGNVAVEDAIYLSRMCSKVYLVHRRNEFRADKALVTEASKQANIEFVLNSTPEEITGTDLVEKVIVRNKETDTLRELPCNGVFIAVGIKPATELFTDLCETDEAGFIKADETGVTSCPGLFAAGDIRTKQLRQIITAASDGANCIASVGKFNG